MASFYEWSTDKKKKDDQNSSITVSGKTFNEYIQEKNAPKASPTRYYDPLTEAAREDAAKAIAVRDYIRYSDPLTMMAREEAEKATRKNDPLMQAAAAPKTDPLMEAARESVSGTQPRSYKTVAELDPATATPGDYMAAIAREQQKAYADMVTPTNPALNAERRKTNREFLNTVLATPTVAPAAGMLDEAWADYNAAAEKWKAQEAKLHTMGGAGDYEILPAAINAAHSGYINAAATLNDYFNQHYAAPTVFNDDGTVNWEASVAAHKPNETVQASVDRLQGMADALADESSKSTQGIQAGRGTLGKVLVGAGVSGIQMAGDAIINTVLPGMGLAAMGVRAFGSSAGEARREGAEVGQQVLYGLANAAVEVLSEKITDIPRFYGGSGWLDDLAKSVAKKWATNPTMYRAVMAGAAALGESIEEFAAGLIEPGLKSLYNDKSFGQNYTKEDWEDMGISMASAFLLGGIGSVNAEVPEFNNQAQRIDTLQTEAEETAPSVTAAAMASEPISIPGQEVNDVNRDLVRSIEKDPEQLARLGIDTKGKTGSQVRAEIRAALETQNDQSKAYNAEQVRQYADSEFADGRISETGASIISSYYSGTQNPSAYIRGMTAAYNAGLNGTDINSVDTSMLSNTQRDAALLAGQAARTQAQKAAPNIEAVRQFTEGEVEAGRMSEDGAKMIFDYYDGTQNANEYISAVAAAYNAGLEGKGAQSVTSPVLTRSQRDAAYMAGQAAARQGQTEPAQATVPEQAAAKAAPPTVDTTQQQRPAEAQKMPAQRAKNPGLVRDENAAKAKLSYTQKRALDTIGKVLGVNVRFVDSISTTNKDGTVRKSGAQGYYDNGEIVLALDGDDPFLTTAVHESVHRIRELSESDYAYLQDFVKRNMSDDKYGLASKIKELDEYSAEEIPEEIVADGFGRILGNEAAMRQFVAENSTAAQHVMDVVADILDRIKQALTGKDSRSLTENQRKVYSDLAGKLDVMMKYYQDAVANVQESEGTGNDAIKFSLQSQKQVRSMNIDWDDNNESSIKSQIINHLDEINAIPSVTTVNYTPGKGPSVFQQLSDILKNRFGYQISRPDGVSFLFDEQAMSTMRHYIDSPEEAAAALAAPYVLKRGKIISGHKNHNNGRYPSLTFAAPATINGKTGNVGVVVQFADKDRVHALRVLTPEGKEFTLQKMDEADPRMSGVPATAGQTISNESASKGSIDEAAGKSNPQNEEAAKFAEHAVGVTVDDASESAAPTGAKLSRRSFLASDYVQDRETAAKDLSDRLGISVAKANRYIDAVNSVAKMIADDRVRLDYESSPGRSSFVGNTEYGGSIDFSTVCKKRRLYTGTIDAIQRAMPDKALTADEMLKIRAEMKKRGYEVSCGLCYVEGSRVNIGKYTQEFLDELKGTDMYVPTMAEINTTDGQEQLRAEHPEVYEQYVKFMNKLAQRKPKLFQMATEYQGEILKKFGNDATVDQKNRNGGLRLQSFSDFEIIHLIDCMQVIMDMSRVGLAGQAYTKVPDFAWALGDTGLKINLSMIAKGVDENGKIIFDEVEGMKEADAKALRDQYSKNVGTILVVFNDEQLKAALNDDFVDFIIPFHRSQWNKGQYEALGLPAGATDYTPQQNESYIEKRVNKNGKPVRPDNFMPNEYWDFDKTGKENAETYLRMCAEDGRRPKFYKLLVDNGDGSYSLQPDGSTDGYWKLLTDFKMYDNEGNGSPQMPVRPDFNMDEAERMLSSYEGGHARFPSAQDVVDDFVNGKFSRSDREILDAYIEEHGAIKTGEKPAREVTIPKRTTPKTKVSMTVRTVAEAGATPEEFVPTIENLVANHEFDYTPYSDEKAIGNATQIAERKGWSKALTDWSNAVSKGEVNKTSTALGWALYNNAVNSGDTEEALNILNLIVKHQRNAAQAVQATRILKQLNPETQLYNAEKTVASLNEELQKKYGDKVPELQIDPDLAERYLRAKDEETRNNAMKDIFRDIGKQMPTTFMDRWTAWRYTAMLGNLRTIGRNVAGNAGFAPVVWTKDAIATAIEGAAGALSGGKMGRTKGNIIGRGELLKAAWDDYATMQEAAMGQSKYSDKQLAQNEIQDARKIFGNTRSKAWNKTGGAVLEAWRKGTNWAMDTTDVWFNKPQYVLAMAQYCAANKISAEQIRSGKGLDKARAYAITEAQKATYRDTNDFSQMVSSLGKSWLKSENKWKKGIATLGEGVLPFRKTPANILARGIEYSPVGMLKALTYDLAQVSKGNMAASEMIDNLSAGLTGTGLLALGVYLASQGLLKGRGGSDDKKKKFAELQGHQDYALELPNGTSVTLDWLAPEALPMFIGANLYEVATEKNENIKLKDILNAIGNVTEPMLEMSMLSSLNELVNGKSFSTDGEINALTSKLSTAATSYLTQAFPTLLGQIERTGENARMQTYTDKNSFLTSDLQYTLGKISAKVPFFDYNQIPYIDAWGREELTGKFIERGANNFVNPSFVSKVESSEMEKELERLYDATGEGGVFPQRAEKYFNVDKERKDLTAKEYLTYATEKGRTSYVTVWGMTNSDLYKGMSDAEKAACIKDVYTYATETARTEVGGKITDSWVEEAVKGINRGIKPETYIMLRKMTNDISGIKNADGNTIANSKGLQVMEKIFSVPGLNDDQRRYLFECFDVGQKVIDYNRSLVNEKLQEMRSGNTTTAKAETKTETKTEAKTETKTETKKEEKPKPETADVTGSSAISAARWEPDTETAYVTWSGNGRTYSYEGVTKSAWDEFKSAKSKGSYVNTHWK